MSDVGPQLVQRAHPRTLRQLSSGRLRSLGNLASTPGYGPVTYFVHGLFSVQFTVSVVHVAGTSNPVADALSRFRMQEFRRLAPAAQCVPDTLPPLPSNRI